MTDDSNANASPLRKALDSLYVRIPELVLAAVGGFGVLIFSLWISNRDIASRLADVDAYIATDQAHMEQLANCVKRAECEAVRALVHAHELRVTKLESEFEGHKAIARERIDRINELEREMRRLSTQPSARPDPFTGSEGRRLSERLDRLEQMEKEEHRQ